jgi:hypothetical protein
LKLGRMARRTLESTLRDTSLRDLVWESGATPNRCTGGAPIMPKIDKMALGRLNRHSTNYSSKN